MQMTFGAVQNLYGLAQSPRHLYCLEGWLSRRKSLGVHLDCEAAVAFLCIRIRRRRCKKEDKNVRAKVKHLWRLQTDILYTKCKRPCNSNITIHLEHVIQQWYNFLQLEKTIARVTTRQNGIFLPFNKTSKMPLSWQSAFGF